MVFLLIKKFEARLILSISHIFVLPTSSIHAHLYLTKHYAHHASMYAASNAITQCKLLFENLSADAMKIYSSFFMIVMARTVKIMKNGFYSSFICLPVVELLHFM